MKHNMIWFSLGFLLILTSTGFLPAAQGAEPWTAAQLTVLGYVIFFLPLLVQGLRWVFAKIGRPLEGKTAPRILSGITAVGVLLLFSFPVFPPFPAFTLSVDGVAVVLGWAQACVVVVTGLVGYLHLLYEYIYRKAFDNTALASKKVG